MTLYCAHTHTDDPIAVKYWRHPRQEMNVHVAVAAR